jgi:opacity protein-like surface antigen
VEVVGAVTNGIRAGSRRFLGAAAVALVALLSSAVHADEVLVTAGRGPQPGSDQRNETVGLDYSFYRYERSARQHVTVGVSYTRLTTNAPDQSSLYAVSVYPQITFFPSATSRIAALSPRWARPFFFVRALGPSYISSSTLGSRRQADSLAFQAQVGVGVQLNPGADRRGVVAVSWKHFSNADLYRDNDGIDVPLVINVGMAF